MLRILQLILVGYMAIVPVFAQQKSVSGTVIDKK